MHKACQPIRVYQSSVLTGLNQLVKQLPFWKMKKK